MVGREAFLGVPRRVSEALQPSVPVLREREVGRDSEGWG